MSPDIISNLTSGAIYDNTMDFWNSITAPPLLSILAPYDVTTIDDICRDPKLKTKLDAKYQYLNQILEPRGFTKLTQGTNRVVYRFREDERFVIKVATSQAGLQDSPAEFRNQQLWLPDVAKCFEVTPSGTIGSFERVTPIKSKEQLMSIIDDLYLFYHRLFKKHGSYVMADIGIEFYKNLGIRDNFGIVLLDYPLAYKIDKNKLFCDRIDRFGYVCGGQIDYDDGFNFLKCTRCGKQYLMKKLAIDSGTIEEALNKNFVKRKEVSDMKVFIKRGNEVIAESRENVINSNYINPAVSVMQQMPTMAARNDGPLKVCVIRPQREEAKVEAAPVEEKAVAPKNIEVSLGKSTEETPVQIDPMTNTVEEDPSEGIETDVEVSINTEAIPEEVEYDGSHYTKEELIRHVEEDTSEENPYLNSLIDRLIAEFEEEIMDLDIAVNYDQILMNNDFDYDKTCEDIRIIIDTAKAQIEEASSKLSNSEEDEEDKQEEVQKECDTEKEPIQNAPFPPIEKQYSNVAMNMESDSDYLGEGSNSKYPAKGKNKRKQNFDNY